MKQLMDNLKKNKVYILFIVLFIVGVVCITIATIEKPKVKEIYQYEIRKNSDYKIILNENEFYTTEILPSGLNYASKSIKDISVDFEYYFDANENKEIQYKYNIYANLIGYVKDNNIDKEIWNRKFDIQSKQMTDKRNEKNYKIVQNVDIDYNYYNNLARSYEKKYGIVIDAVLKLRFDISCDINKDFEKIDDYIELNIPITETITNVTENYERTTQKKMDSNSESLDFKKIVLYIIGIIFILSTIFAIVCKNLKNKYNVKERKYIKNISRILKHNRDFIVSVKNKPNIADLKVIEIDAIEDLLYIAELNQKNIIHYEKIKNMEDCFYIIINDFVYTLTIKLNDEVKI